MRIENENVNESVNLNYKIEEKEINFSFSPDCDIFGYMDNYINFLKAITFSDIVIVNGLINALYEFVDKAEFEGNKEVIEKIKEMLNELEYLKGKDNG